MNLREDELIFLIGAGCSVDGRILSSTEMVDKLEEKLLSNQKDFKNFRDLYFFLKGAINYSDEIQGLKPSFNIEKLVNVLYELEKKEKIILYPFIGSWNIRLLELDGFKLEKCISFKDKITTELKGWVQPESYKSTNYYKHFFKFAQEIEYGLRVFSLNYDLCFEKNLEPIYDLETGFDSNNTWNSQRFEKNEYGRNALYLYKLHGSINWERKNNILRSVDNIDIIKPELIFGTIYKLQYIDPYLFYIHEFRKYSIAARFIICIGFSFGDDHIRDIIYQSLKYDNEKKILVVAPNADLVIKSWQKIVCEMISKETFYNEEMIRNEEKAVDNVFNKQVISCKKTAKEFLQSLSINELENVLMLSKNPDLEVDKNLRLDDLDNISSQYQKELKKKTKKPIK